MTKPHLSNGAEVQALPTTICCVSASYIHTCMFAGSMRVSASHIHTCMFAGSMGVGSFITKGKGDPQAWNSCSHGAGRAMSRTQARKTIAQVSMQSPLVCNGCILAVFMLAVVWHLATASNFVESPASYSCFCQCKWVAEVWGVSGMQAQWFSTGTDQLLMKAFAACFAMGVCFMMQPSILEPVF